MQQYAIHEIRDLLNRLTSPIHDRDPIVRYVCALFAELAYYHVPAFEIDDQKRAKVIPCEAYQALIRRGTPTNVAVYLQQAEFGRSFVVVDRGVIAVGVALNKLLFVGFRDTQFLFDWRINLRAKLIEVAARPRLHGRYVFFNTSSRRIHRGFAEESLRISLKVLDAIRDNNLGDIEHIFFTGHSLGGAVAAIADDFLEVAPSSVCIFGSPRYCDGSAHVTLANRPATQVRRPGDIVPTVPPRWFGYVDHPYEFNPAGQPIVDPVGHYSFSQDLWRWAKFLGTRFAAHNIEDYRHELGQSADATGALAPLAPFEKLTPEKLTPADENAGAIPIPPSSGGVSETSEYVRLPGSRINKRKPPLPLR